MYVEKRKEFRFVWLNEEIKRLNQENPEWQNQSSVVLRFLQILDEATITHIHDQIIKEGILHRRIKETLNEASKGSIKLVIDSEDFEVTDTQDARAILLNYNVELLNSGREALVLEKYSLLSKEDQDDAKFLMLKAGAEANQGLYKTALDTIALIEVTELNKGQRMFVEIIENLCNWHTGSISYEDYNQKYKQISEMEVGKNPLLEKFSYHLTDLLGEEEYDLRKEKLEILKKLVEEIRSEKRISPDAKLGIEVSLLEAEETQLTSDYILMNSALLQFVASGAMPKTLMSPLEWTEKNNSWYQRANALIKENLHNPIRQADILLLDVRHWFFMRMMERITNKYLKVGEGFKQTELDVRFEHIKAAIDIYQQSKSHFNVIRAKILLCELLGFSGNDAEAQKISEDLNSISRKRSYLNLIEDSLMSTRFKEIEERFERISPV